MFLFHSFIHLIFDFSLKKDSSKLCNLLYSSSQFFSSSWSCESYGFWKSNFWISSSWNLTFSTFFVICPYFSLLRSFKGVFRFLSFLTSLLGGLLDCLSAHEVLRISLKVGYFIQPLMNLKGLGSKFWLVWIDRIPRAWSEDNGGSYTSWWWGKILFQCSLQNMWSNLVLLCKGIPIRVLQEELVCVVLI